MLSDTTTGNRTACRVVRVINSRLTLGVLEDFYCKRSLKQNNFCRIRMRARVHKLHPHVVHSWADYILYPHGRDPATCFVLQLAYGIYYM